MQVGKGLRGLHLHLLRAHPQPEKPQGKDEEGQTLLDPSPSPLSYPLVSLPYRPKDSFTPAHEGRLALHFLMTQA